jgi:hypothetical protein
VNGLSWSWSDWFRLSWTKASVNSLGTEQHNEKDLSGSRQFEGSPNDGEFWSALCGLTKSDGGMVMGTQERCKGLRIEMAC